MTKEDLYNLLIRKHGKKSHGYIFGNSHIFVSVDHEAKSVDIIIYNGRDLFFIESAYTCYVICKGLDLL